MSPAEREMISPGTRSKMGSSCTVPSRRTVAFVTIFFRAVRLPARPLYSWKKSMVTLMKTITMIIAALMIPPVNAEITAAKSRMITRKFLKCLKLEDDRAFPDLGDIVWPVPLKACRSLGRRKSTVCRPENCHNLRFRRRMERDVPGFLVTVLKFLVLFSHAGQRHLQGMVTCWR